MSSKLKDKLNMKSVPGVEPAHREFELTPFEAAFIRELGTLLLYHIARDAIISSFLTYIATTRLGYQQPPEGYEVRFDINLERTPSLVLMRELKIEEDE